MALFLRIVVAALLCAVGARAQEGGLYDRPVLRLDPGVHTAAIIRADVDREGRWVVTGSQDCTVRVWSAASGALERTIPVPTGPGNIGRIDAVAISPDGATIAAGGWTRWTPTDQQEQIYLFDRASGAMLRRIEGLPDVVLHLAFSPDGARLLAALGGGEGVRLFDAATGAEVARDADYGDASYGAAFAQDGGFVTTAWDGDLRLYDRDGRLRDRAPSGHGRPFGVAVHPDGDRVAVGFADTTAVRVVSLAGGRLRPLLDADSIGVANGSLSTVAWSRDGGRLFAGGRYDEDGVRPVLVWEAAGRGARRNLPAGRDRLAAILPLAAGDLLAVAADPWLGRLDPAGAPRWTRPPAQADLRDQRETLALSQDGARVGFGYAFGGAEPATFDVAALRLVAGAGVGLAPPDQARLKVTDWEDDVAPKLDGAPLPLDRYETLRSLAIHPDGARFVLGADWWLRAFSADGAELWRREAPGVVWAVNISGDGRYAVAAYGDGTVRWHRMDDGAELLAFFPHADRRNWVAWTPECWHASTPGMDSALFWQTNRGWDQTPEMRPVSAIKGFFEPEAIKALLATGDIERALERARYNRPEQCEARAEPDAKPVAARLHIMTVGVSAYGRHPKLKLDYADDDANDLADRLMEQAHLFNAVKVEGPLVDDLATRAAILTGLRRLSERFRDDGQDVAVIAFSGHGAMVGEDYYLLPHDVDANSLGGIEDTGVALSEVLRRVRRMAEKGKVLVLLDACHSGAVVDGTKALPPDIDAVRAALVKAGPGASVLTSSSGTEISREDPAWENGAFTEAVLEALGPAGDKDGDRWISLKEIESHVVDRVAELTGSAQTPRLSTPGERGFEAKLFRLAD